MPLTNTQYDQILHQYEERQRKRRRELEDRRERVYERIPDYRRLEEETASLSVAQGKKLLFGEEGAMRDLRVSLSDLRAKRERLLAEAGFDKDYLEPPFLCPDCQDTGYVDGAKCHCFRQAEISLLYEQSGISEMLRQNNFSLLSYDYHTGEDRAHFEKAVETCKNFVKNFDSDYHNLFFYGTVGTGKSFLSGCVAKDLIDTGHAVIYFSATGLFELLSSAAFDAKNREERRNAYADLYGCDLLIIDDLGTELTNQFTASQLFSLLNERAIGKKAVIISTNLSLRELQDRYSDRIFSRITSNFEVCKLTGPDIRMYQKRQQNRK
ncbi:MAG: ATP-binding protein [Bacteroidales bacterium]|nr:ATP-binding protein [Bacteroidales bacterium]MCM1416951.1 ATP-binding protein [bacterium]MCM1424915.1 ATP-binding protein [bacterium]